LALSNAPYAETYDAKSSKFIEASLNYIDDFYKGFRKIVQEIEPSEDSETGEKQ
jgi:hypothetical protein